MKIAIIGAGNMGGSIARGLAKGTVIQTENICVSNPSRVKLDALKAEFPAIQVTHSNVEAAKNADIVLLAVKPWLIEQIVKELPLDEEKQMLIKVFDYIVNVHEELLEYKEKAVAKKLYTETHFVSLLPYIKKSMDNDVNESMFAEYLINFFKVENDSDVYTEYMEACSNAIARNANIVARHEALGKSYNEYFKTEESNVEVDSEDELTTA